MPLKSPKVISGITRYTRSVTSKFEKTYDFDESSKEWCKNKTKKKLGMYEYTNSE
jgi:hypothetical protein